MRQHVIRTSVAAVIAALSFSPVKVSADESQGRDHGDHGNRDDVQLGPRPFYLVDKMEDGRLKRQLQRCEDDGSYRQTDFSIGHRGGAPLQFPEHTKESHEAGALMGAGILECDVTFTSDAELVCRHDQCDLHTTTNILLVPELAAKCTQPFSPAEFDAPGTRTKAASALCCTSDLTLAELKKLKGKMDASNANARTPQEFQGGTANWRTDLYATGGTLLSHKESIRLIRSLGAKFTPELKGPNRAADLQVEEVFGSQGAYAQKMIDEYKEAGISPRNVFAQSFNLADVLYWIRQEPEFGRQAVYLDDANLPAQLPTLAELQSYYAQGVRIVGPPMYALLTVDGGRIVPSQYARNAKAARLKIITWTLERSGRIVEEVLPTNGTASPSFYYQTTLDALHNDGDILVTLDVLAKQVGILGIFSDWSATVSFYANCMGLK
jgi:glycerophosphoryl diester phosphodiesterase